jgi:hypothetical protein
MLNKPLVILFMISLLITGSVKGQKMVNSPYSRFNLGSIVPSGSYRSLAMGGVGAAMRDNNSIYFVNPASYSSVDTTSFLLDFGGDYSSNSLSDGVNKYKSHDMNFGHLIIGFPLAKGIGFATGLVPYSNGYYSIQEVLKQGDNGYDPLTGQVISTHRGDGSLTNFFFGTGINLNRNFSIGANMTILFGQLTRYNQFEFGDYTNSFAQYNSEKIRIRGINLDYGAQYTAYLKKDHFLTVGVSYTGARKYQSEFETISERFTPYGTSAYSPDTLEIKNESSRDSTRMPSSLRVGLAFGKKDKFVVGIDYILSNWSEARIHGSLSGYLANTESLLIGMEYIPDKYSNTSFMDRIEYRLGGHVSNNYLMLNGTQIKEYGASCGFGFRMRNNSLSKATVYFDYTKKVGDLSKGLHKENIFTVGVSLNLYEFWFIKKKFD